jgi:hypothetical protein
VLANKLGKVLLLAALWTVIEAKTQAACKNSPFLPQRAARSVGELLDHAPKVE